MKPRARLDSLRRVMVWLTDPLKVTEAVRPFAGVEAVRPFRQESGCEAGVLAGDAADDDGACARRTRPCLFPQERERQL